MIAAFTLVDHILSKTAAVKREQSLKLDLCEWNINLVVWLLEVEMSFPLQGVCAQLEGQHVELRYLGGNFSSFTSKAAMSFISTLNFIIIYLFLFFSLWQSSIYLSDWNVASSTIFYYKYERFCTNGTSAAACRFASFTAPRVSVCSGTGCNYTVWQQSSRGWLTHSSELLVWDCHRSPASCYSSIMRTTSRTSNIHLDRFSCIIHWLLFTSNCEAGLGHYSISK